jgi:predicted RNA binding protein YcfA (HicA-like mRNA interferase family)
MPKLKRLSGKEVVSFCEENGFSISRQKGSHINLVRTVFDRKQVVTVPNHKELDRGTLHSIFKKLLVYLSEKDLQDFFYSE